MSEAISSMEETFQRILPEVPFTYDFADDAYSRKFAMEERIGRLSAIFAVLAIVISCLGLFGLAAFVAEQRTKEIGIRKVVGASLLSLWQLQAKSFIWLVLVSSFIALPIAYFGMQQWLNLYEYKVPLSWWIFAFAVLGSVLMTLLTVSFQAIRAAKLNPVTSLRSE